MSKLILKLKAYRRLGLTSIARVAAYRLRLRLGIHPVQRISASVPPGPFFRKPANARLTELPVNRQWQRQQCFFGWFTVATPECPDWLTNPFTGKSFPAADLPWWAIPDFSSEIGDIKTVWEASRFDWVLGFAQQACQGDAAALDKLNAWLADWSTKNPPYLGPNWKCGQEASIRVMHLAMAALLLGQADKPELALVSLIEAHLKRIAPTISYAIAQDNNHGTSEAAALFIGGSWLAKQGKPIGAIWARLGRKWLKNRATHLIAHDGSFSQYSVNYHRVMLDTYCMAEVWRQNFSRPPFSKRLYEQVCKATYWLYQVVDTETGEAPNLGANDGARLLPLTETDYRDYRPTVQLSMALFRHCRAYEHDGAWNLPLRWLDIPLPHGLAKEPESQHFKDGGYCILRHDYALALLRYPRFRFRPSHADALHLDLWLGDQNILRDGGSFSYANDEAVTYYSGTESHNTIQFDERDQMPRLGRFLFGEWLHTNQFEPITAADGTVATAASYRDGQGAHHTRKIELSEHSLRVTDDISGFRQKAVMRWRLTPGNWMVGGNSVSNGKIKLTVTGNMPIRRFALTEGRESRYYLQQTPIPVLEVEVKTLGKLETTIEWDD